MSDIDFDELDLAVASVLNKEPAAAATTPASVQRQASPVPVSVATDKPLAANAADLHRPAPVVSRGRFLDMVHPSGDMSGRPAQAVAPRPTPAAPPVFATEPVIAPVPVRSTPAPVSSPVAVVPTPIASSPSPAAPAPADAQPHDAPKDFFAASPNDASPHTTPDVPPVGSPFIPDAKVEKRPLGAYSPDGSQVVTPTPLASMSPFASATPAQSDSVHAQLTQIESENNVVPETVQPVAAQPAPAPQPAPALQAPTPVAAPVSPAPSPASPTPAIQRRPDPTSVPSSITTGDDNKSARSIQPLTTMEAPTFFKHVEPQAEKPLDLPKHGHPAWIWITVAVAILLIGFGVGASLYFTVLQ